MPTASHKYRLAASPVWLLKDEASVRRHVRSDDYFGTIATILSLLKQQIKKDGARNAALLTATLQNVESDLMFLQKNYLINQRPQRLGAGRALHIQPSIKNRKIRPKGKLKSQ